MSSSTADTYLLLRAFVDELARCGMRDAVTSPGSRNTPLLLSLVRDGRLRCVSQIDERVGGFHALGLAKATRRPVAVCCTSGTAAAHYAPAVIEAHEAGVPLLVLTADRPPELREAGAGQAIDQLKLYGDAVRWFFDVGDGHVASVERLRWMRSLACRAVWAASDGHGPVHLNFALREPLVLDAPLPEDPLPGRMDGRPWLAHDAVPPVSSGSELAAALAGAHRPVVVAGRAERDAELGEAVARFAGAAGAPLLADPLSGARRGPAAVAHYDALLRVESFAARHRPDLVVRVGDLPTSKPLRAWLAGLSEARQVAFAPESRWHDPAGSLDTLLAGDPRTTLDAVEPAAVTPAWLHSWQGADERAAGAIESVLPGLSEPDIAARLIERLPAAACLVVGSSMPIRDVETFAPVRDDGGPRVLANRGANGIDGTVATALGVAASGAPTVLLLGDVALVHDLGGLASAPRLGLPLAVVVLDNGGGGIFDFLPVSRERDVFEEHVATPPGINLAGVAMALGLRVARPTSPAAVGRAIGRAWNRGLTLIHVRTDRAENVDLHRRVWAAVAAAVH